MVFLLRVYHWQRNHCIAHVAAAHQLGELVATDVQSPKFGESHEAFR